MSQLNFAVEAARDSVAAASSRPASITAITANQLLPGWIRRRRKSLDLTQGDLAQRLACSLSTVQKVEEGERRPSKILATHLLEALEIPEGERPVFMRLARGKPASRHEPALRSTSHSDDSDPTPINNTPFPTNALIAREAETAWVQGLLAGDDARWVTLTGLPGVGKTRLAQHIAHSVHFEDGVCYVSLANLPPQANCGLACAAVAAAIAKSLRLNQEQEAPDALIAHLREMHLLLVLDDIENVLAARDLLIRLLQETRWVKLLVTSRQRLRLHAEHVVQLVGLPIGENSPALKLFLVRASRVAGPAFREKYAAQKVERICRLVDGLPLGIEMACELTATQSLDEIGDAIERDLDVLHTTSPDVPEAHRSLRGVFASLWGQLSAAERRVVGQCAAFQDGFGFEEASRMVQFSDEREGCCTGLRAMFDGLIEKAVLRRIMTDDASDAQPGLYLLHPLLRWFAADPRPLKGSRG